MRRLIWCMDLTTTATLLFTAVYMYQVFADLFSRTLMFSCLIGVIFMLVLQAENMRLRHKRRIANVIEAPAREFTS